MTDQGTALFKGDRVLIENVEWLTGLRQRLRGLLGKRGLPAGRAVCLVPCGSIHTFFMRFSLDVIFLDRNLKVTRILKHLAPGRMAWGGKDAHMAVEMQAGWLPVDALEQGETVSFRNPLCLCSCIPGGGG